MPPKSRRSSSSSKLGLGLGAGSKMDKAKLLKELKKPQFILLSVIVTILFGIFLLYVLDLEQQQCHCSDDWKRDLVKYYMIFLIGLRVVSLVLPSINVFLMGQPVLTGIMSLLNVGVMVLIIFFVKELRDQDCECSENWKRTFMEIYAYIVLVALGITTLLMIFAIITLVAMTPKNLKKGA